MMSTKRFEIVAFYVVVTLLIYPILTNTFFLTGDGPCHVYNSKVLLDFVTDNSVDFYSEYYNLNQNTEPNWFSHVVLALLLTVFSDSTAEKILLISYVLIFSFSIRGVIRSISKGNMFLVFLGLPFVFHRMVQMGFYNYSFGFAFCFLSVWFWLKNRSRLNWWRILIFGLLNLLTYFTHPIGFLMSGLIIGAIALGELVRNEDAQNRYADTIKSLGKILLGFSPGIVLMLEYLTRKGLNPTPNPDSTKQLYHDFLELTSIVNLTDNEALLAVLVSILFGVLVLYSIVHKIKTRSMNRYDGLSGAFLLMVFIYFNQPAEMAGAGILSVRLQFLPYLIVLLWLAGNTYNRYLKTAVSIVGFAVLVSFSLLRIPIHDLASKAVEEYVSVRDHIPSRSTVLPLSYEHSGKTPNGDLVSSKIWLFMHAADYIGSDRSLVMLSNYEAATGYFPIIWKDSRNPYVYLSKGVGLEHLPPSIDIPKYETATGAEVDYVITWCLDEQFLNRKETVDILQQLVSGYELIYTSENGLAKLYESTRVQTPPNS